GLTMALLACGVVMLASASLGIAEQELKDPFYFVIRQSIYIAIGLSVGFFVMRIKLEAWQRLANPLLAIGLVLLVLVLLPGIGKQVNGSARWLNLGLFSLQVSELVKLLIIVYFASLLVVKRDEINQSLTNCITALIPLGIVALLLLAEPDLGATVVVVGTILGLFFLVGVRLSYFVLLLGVALAGSVTLIITSSYRLKRLVSYLSACEPQFYHEQGYQLCQALIAFGRGEWLGVGLGSGVQKQFYLPEAHTDFLLAVLGEELGAVGTITVILLFAAMFVRALKIAQQAEAANLRFGAYLGYGITLWIGLQALVNIGVNMGALPTKGITLPLVSYGGSSIVITCVAIALLLRIAYESRLSN
ncbi:MAG: cell division protein FtsW, partial [Halothiobacillaceae bacterium]